MKKNVLAVAAYILGSFTGPQQSLAQEDRSISVGQCFDRSQTVEMFTGNREFDVLLRWQGTETKLHRDLLLNKEHRYWVLLAETSRQPVTYCVTGVGYSIGSQTSFSGYRALDVPCDQQLQQLRWRPLSLDGITTTYGRQYDNYTQTIGSIGAIGRENGWDQSMIDRQADLLRRAREALGLPNADYCTSQGSLSLSSLLLAMYPNGPQREILDGEVLQISGVEDASRLIIVRGRDEGGTIGTPMWGFVVDEQNRVKVSMAGIETLVGRPGE